MVTVTASSASQDVILRPATLADAGLLLGWRNDLLTRAESLNSNEIQAEEHESWLKSVLANSYRQLCVAEVSGVAAGTVRADFYADENRFELSWTVAPQFRGQGVGKVMVKLLADQLSNHTIFARVKPNNRASINIALYAGMEPSGESDGVLYFQRRPVGRSLQ